MSEKTAYERLADINVGDHIEKKNNLSYLSWAWAVDQLLRQDAKATWEYKEPVRWGDTVMVFCTVTAFGKPMTAQLPVMDYKNKAIPNPDAFAVNTAMQRCLAKAIALHGLGLYIYAGEDLPLTEAEAVAAEKEAAKKPAQSVAKDIWDITDEPTKRKLQGIADAVRQCMESGDMEQALNIYGEITDVDEKTALWSRFDSKERSSIKKAAETKRTQQ